LSVGDQPLAFERVASLAEVSESEGLSVRSAGVRVGLFAVDGEIYAIENRCPHANAALVGGELRGCVIFCPVHHWDFDVRTGFRPDYPDGFPIPCFAVEVREGAVWLDVEDVINRPQEGARHE
jgi:nitrite reductase/ring-hydroxylating ferredoxin subunit